MLIFAAATQGYFMITRNRWYESILLLLVAFTLFRPGFWMDMIVPAYNEISPTEMERIASEVPPGQEFRLHVDGVNDIGDPISFVAILALPDGATGSERLENAGVEFIEMDGQLVVDNVAFNSIAQRAGLDWDQTVTGVLVPNPQPWKELMYIPALIVLGLIILAQRRRRDKTASPDASPATSAA
jgi:acyl-CoA synthetase (AMP-forming)/AMP-acid ligase II